jgi:hypothetical protein
LSLAALPEPDLFIRTGGEQRISNFALAAGLYRTLFYRYPVAGFRREQFARRAGLFARRQRRFGQTGDQVERIRVLKRLLTAAFLIPLAVWGILRLPTPLFTAATGVFIALAVWEWTGLVPLRTVPAKLVYVLGFSILAGVAWTVQQQQPALLIYLLSAAVIWWCWRPWLRSPDRARRSRLNSYRLAGVIARVAGTAALHGRAEHGPEPALFIFVLMWVADSAPFRR